MNEERTWSLQQVEIFDEFTHGKANAIVVARAGTGKTTTGVEGVKRAPERKILFCAYNKKIEQELAKRFGPDPETGVVACPHVTVKTIHALGLSCVRRFRDNILVEFTNDRANALALAVCGARAPDAILRLVAKLHTKGREIAPHAVHMGDLTDLAITFECEPDASWASQGFDLAYIEEKALAAMELASDIKSGATIDGSDMIFLPVRNHWVNKQFDLVVVDEAQDMTVAMLEIAQGVCSGRIIVIGDDRQAIYGFRGADSESLSRLQRELSARELKLTRTYRCGRKIVELAQMLVPDFVSGEGSHEGEILHIPSNELVGMAGPSDFVLSRSNAPLVSIAMSLLRAGKRTRIAGKDIGAGLKALVRKLKGRSVPDFLAKISAWETREIDRLMHIKRDMQARIDAIHDQAEMLIGLSDGAKNVDEITLRIDSLFTDDGLGDAGVITCSSVHKSKGLEASRVFILSDTLKAFNQEELNIQYVAITRAINTLVWVDPVVPVLPAPPEGVEPWPGSGTTAPS